jgi:putative two-component system response regulator
MAVEDKTPHRYNAVPQLEKGAEDFAEFYQYKREKRKQLKAVNQQLMRYADDINTTISELKAAHEELQDAFLDTIHRLALAAEYKDEETGNHIVRMSRYSAFIAERLALSKKEVQNILYASPLHDLGKIGIPDSIFLKPGRLTDEEFAIMKTHTIIGANILAYSDAEVLQVAEQIAISHHEKWNGRGYPQGLSAQKIPMLARIVGLADVFDALTSKRPYKEPYPIEVAVNIIKKERGQSLDPDIVDAFLDCVDEIVAIKEEVDETEVVRAADFTYSERDLIQHMYE